MRKFIDSSNRLISELAGSSSLICESFGKVINFDPRVDPTVFDLDVKARQGTLTKDEVEEFGKFLRDNRMEFIRMYHGTSERHDVFAKGLLPTTPGRAKSLQSGHGYVYLTYDPMRALNFAQMAYAGDSAKDLVVYAVDVQVKRLLPDHDQLRNQRMVGNDLGDDIAASMIMGAGARVRGKIDPMQIHVYGRFDRRGDPVD